MFPNLPGTPRKPKEALDGLGETNRKENERLILNQLGNSLESLSLDKDGDGGKSRPTTSGSVGIASDYGSRPSTGDGTLKHDSRPPTRDDAIMHFDDSLTMFQTRPGTADSDFYGSETQSRPGTSGSMTFSRPVTKRAMINHALRLEKILPKMTITTNYVNITMKAKMVEALVQERVEA